MANPALLLYGLVLPRFLVLGIVETLSQAVQAGVLPPINPNGSINNSFNNTNFVNTNTSSPTSPSTSSSSSLSRPLLTRSGIHIARPRRTPVAPIRPGESLEYALYEAYAGVKKLLEGAQGVDWEEAKTKVKFALVAIAVCGAVHFLGFYLVLVSLGSFEGFLEDLLNMRQDKATNVAFHTLGALCLSIVFTMALRMDRNPMEDIEQTAAKWLSQSAATKKKPIASRSSPSSSSPSIGSVNNNNTTSTSTSPSVPTSSSREPLSSSSTVETSDVSPSSTSLAASVNDDPGAGVGIANVPSVLH